MKKVLFSFLIIGIIGVISSCDNDDSPSVEQQPIEKSWHLENMKGGLIGINIDYKKEEVIWTFDGSNGTVKVENNITTTGPENNSGFQTGTYSYETRELGNSIVLFINGMEQGDVSFTEKKLIIDDNVAADGFVRTFVTND